MDVDSFDKKGIKGKGDGKNGKEGSKGQNLSQNPNPSQDVVCWHCCKNPRNQSGSGGGHNKRGKGKPKRSTGKGPGSLEQGEQAAVVEPQPQPALSQDLASIETPVRSPHLDHEGWLRRKYVTGAAIAACPLDARIGTETQVNDCSYKTASGELNMGRE